MLRATESPPMILPMQSPLHVQLPLNPFTGRKRQAERD